MSTPPTRPPGRPRSEKARQAVLRATLELAAEEGPRGLRMEAIAKRAAVSKETLYRWWHSKTEVVLEALSERSLATIPLPDSGSLRGDLSAFLHATVEAGDDTTRRLLRTLAAEAASDPGFADLVTRQFLATRRASLGALLQRGVERGELTSRQAAIAIDLIYGSLWYRLIFQIAPLDSNWAQDVTDALAPPS
jgi:AcrR family transcriptional regulator